MKQFLCVMLLALCGCASMGTFNKVRPGMTRAEVEDRLGEPSEVASAGTTQYYKYSVVNSPWWGQVLGCGLTAGLYPYLIPGVQTRLVALDDGKVVMTGQVGDFDTTAPVTRKYIIENR